MKKSYFVAGILATAIGVTASTAYAFGQRHGGQSMDISFEDLDADGDGQITEAEMQAMGKVRFDLVDTDGNGILSAGEMQAQAQQKMGKRVAAMIEKFDQDGDGALSRDEMPKAHNAGRKFGHLDKDSSGGISEQEFSDARDSMRRHKKGGWGGHQNKN